jgi:hypothetical protein
MISGPLSTIIELYRTLQYTSTHFPFPSPFPFRSTAPFCAPIPFASIVEVILITLDEFADITCLFCNQAIFLVLWCTGTQLGPHLERFFERKNLRCLGFNLASCGKEFLLELSIWGLCVLASEPFWEKRGDGKITYLVRCHIKVNLGGTCWARLVSAVLVNCLAREDKVHELLDARVEISHRLALVKLLQNPVNWASGGDREFTLCARLVEKRWLAVVVWAGSYLGHSAVS